MRWNSIFKKIMTSQKIEINLFCISKLCYSRLKVFLILGLYISFTYSFSYSFSFSLNISCNSRLFGAFLPPFYLCRKCNCHNPFLSNWHNSHIVFCHLRLTKETFVKSQFFQIIKDNWGSKFCIQIEISRNFHTWLRSP